jgi:hypothetical protein
LYVPDTRIVIRLTHDEAGNDVFYDDGETFIPAQPQATAGQATIFLRPIEIQAGETFYVHYNARASGLFTGNGLALGNGSEVVLNFNGDINANPTEETLGVIAVTPENKINFDRLQLGSIQTQYPGGDGSVMLTLSRDDAGQDIMATAEAPIRFSDAPSLVTFSFPTVSIETDRAYFIGITNHAGVALRPSGALLAMETSWDDSLPLRLPGYDPFGGIYRMGNIELFEPDTAVKRDNIVDVLARADYLVISSNRGYDAMPRLPLRYPMTLKYYQTLFGCNVQFIYECAYPAEVGFF